MIKKLTTGFLAFSLLALLLFPLATKAEIDPNYYTSGTNGLQLGNDLTPKETAVEIINLVLSFLGLVAVVIVLIGGFKWMTAGGNEEKVGSAKKLLVSGLIGLIIVLLAWGISTWVIEQVAEWG
jgi:Zn-dependent protease with chaperone function